jgi:hypothetical protein
VKPIPQAKDTEGQVHFKDQFRKNIRSLLSKTLSYYRQNYLEDGDCEFVKTKNNKKNKLSSAEGDESAKKRSKKAAVNNDDDDDNTN